MYRRSKRIHALTTDLTFVLASVGTLLLGAHDAYAAGLRCYDNPPLSSVPSTISNGQGDLLSAGYIDITLPPYNADNTGTTDAAGALQDAIDDAYVYSFTVWVPKGTYLIGSPIVAVQQEGFGGCGASNRKFINVVMGDASGGTFPVLKARDNTFKGVPMIKFMFEGDDATRHYGSIFRGFELDMGNNPNGWGLRMEGAQLCSIEDLLITGNFDTGIFNLPGSGGSTTGVTVIGGRVGIRQDQYRPTPSLHGIVLKDQSQYGIRLDKARGGLIIVGFQIENSGQAGVFIPGVDSSGFPQRNLIMVDGTFDLSAPAVKGDENTMHLRNIYAKTATIVDNGPVGSLSGDANAWTRVGEYATSGRYGTALFVDGQNRGTQTDLATDVAPVAAPPANLVRMHAPDPARMPSYFNTGVLDIRDYGATADQHGDDDAPAINTALADSAVHGIPAFVPRGRFNVSQPVKVPLGASMIGVSFGNSMIYADENWLPTSQTAVLRTEDGVGNVLFMDFATVVHEPATSKGMENTRNMYCFHGRSSNMLLRNMIPDRKEYWAGGEQLWGQTVAYFSGNAGGRVYNLALDFHERTTSQGKLPHHMFAVVGTHHPLAFYQPNTESSANDPQVIIEDAENVTWYALKYEATSGSRELLEIRNSRNIAVLGGSGNYSMDGSRTMVRVKNSTGVVISLIVRQGTGGDALLKDGSVTIPADKKISTYRIGTVKTFGSLNPPDFPYPGDGPADIDIGGPTGYTR